MLNRIYKVFKRFINTVYSCICDNLLFCIQYEHYSSEDTYKWIICMPYIMYTSFIFSVVVLVMLLTTCSVFKSDTLPIMCAYHKQSNFALPNCISIYTLICVVAVFLFH